MALNWVKEIFMKKKSLIYSDLSKKQLQNLKEFYVKKKVVVEDLAALEKDYEEVGIETSKKINKT